MMGPAVVMPNPQGLPGGQFIHAVLRYHEAVMLSDLHPDTADLAVGLVVDLPLRYFNKNRQFFFSYF
jgi:hypothetical protein